MAIRITDWLADGQIPIHTNEEREPVSAGLGHAKHWHDVNLNVRPDDSPVQCIFANMQIFLYGKQMAKTKDNTKNTVSTRASHRS